MTATPMTKAIFLSHLKSLYRVGNMSDSDNPMRPDWAVPNLAGEGLCQHLDAIFHGLVKSGVITAEDCQTIYDTL